jgi:hypothetical protein
VRVQVIQLTQAILGLRKPNDLVFVHV